jgi:hypothetical protein
MILFDVSGDQALSAMAHSNALEPPFIINLVPQFMSEISLVALAIQRRSVALVHFRHSHLDDVLVRHIPAAPEKAISSIIGLINQTTDLQNVEYAAIERPQAGDSRRLRELYAASLALFRSKGIPCSEVEPTELLESFSQPALGRRSQLRKIGRTIWPALNTAKATHAAIDAAILGLHVQIQRLFALHEVVQ